MLLLPQSAAAQVKNAVLLVEHPQIHSVGIIEHYVSTIKSRLEKEGYLFKPVDSIPAWITDNDHECRDPEGRENIHSGIQKRINEADERFFNNNDIAGAITLLEKALDLFREHPGAAADKKELLERIYSAGVSLVRLYLLNSQKERAAFIRDYLLRLFPDRIPDLSIVPPDVVDFFTKGEKIDVGNCKLRIIVHPKASALFASHLINGIKKSDGEEGFKVPCGQELILQTIFRDGVSFKRKIVTAGEAEIDVYEIESRIFITKVHDYLRVTGLNSNDAILGVADLFGKFVGAEEVFFALFTETDKTELLLEVFSSVPGGEKIRRLAMVSINIGEKPFPELFLSRISPEMEEDTRRFFTYIALGVSIVSLGTGVVFNIKTNSQIDAINNGTDRFSALSSDRTLMYSFYGAGAAALAAAVLLYFIEGE